MSTVGYVTFPGTSGTSLFPCSVRIDQATNTGEPAATAPSSTRHTASQDQPTTTFVSTSTTTAVTGIPGNLGKLSGKSSVTARICPSLNPTTPSCHFFHLSHVAGFFFLLIKPHGTVGGGAASCTRSVPGARTVEHTYPP